jgi:nicotinamide riboside transporter PnuC
VAIEDIHLAEFNRCRDEIDNRTDISEKLVLAQITALGTGIAVLDKTPDVLLGLSAVTSFLWLFWTAHTHATSQLSGYIALQLAPRLRGLVQNHRVLGWEEYRRIYPSLTRSTDIESPEKPKNAADWKLWLFAGTTPVLLLVYVLILWKKRSCLMQPKDIVTYVRACMTFLSIIVFRFAWKQYNVVKRKWEEIDETVIKMANTTKD